MVSTEQVVVDGLRDTHYTALVTRLHHILGNLVAGVHGVVAAVVEEVTDVVLLEHFKNTLVIGVVNIRISQLVAAGTQCRGRSITQKLELFAVFLVDVIQVIVEQTLDAMCHAEYTGDGIGVQSSLQSTQNRRVDYRSRTTGLTDDASAF